MAPRSTYRRRMAVPIGSRATFRHYSAPPGPEQATTGTLNVNTARADAGLRGLARLVAPGRRRQPLGEWAPGRSGAGHHRLSGLLAGPIRCRTPPLARPGRRSRPTAAGNRTGPAAR